MGVAKRKSPAGRFFVRQGMELWLFHSNFSGVSRGVRGGDHGFRGLRLRVADGGRDVPPSLLVFPQAPGGKGGNRTAAESLKE